MTEVPEHLLRRSKERRAAMGLGDGDADAAPSAPSEPAAAAEGAAPAAATPAVPDAAAPAVPEPVIEALPAYVEPVSTRRLPVWVYPVIAVLPFWAFVYFGAFGERGQQGPVDPLVLGEQLYAEMGCAGCHGATGGGGSGPALADGEATKTFPDEADHIKWVETGSGPFKGQPYGDAAREGGQHVAQTGLMPSFAGRMSAEEIEAVVQYEREGL